MMSGNDERAKGTRRRQAQERQKLEQKSTFKRKQEEEQPKPRQPKQLEQSRQFEEDPVFKAILQKAGGDFEKMQQLLEEDLDVLFEDLEIRALLLGEKKEEEEEEADGGGRNSPAAHPSHYSRDGDEEHVEEEEDDHDNDREEQEEDNTTVEEKIPKMKVKEQTVPAASSGWWGIYTGMRDVYHTLFSPEVLVEDILVEFEAKESREMEWKRRAAAIQPCSLLSGRRGLKIRGSSSCPSAS